MAGRSTRVLLIEDNAIDAIVTERRLMGGARAGYALTTVGSLDEAWPLLEGDRFDVVLTDLNLPTSEGLDTLSQLRARAAHLPLVVLTAASEAAIGVRAVQMGAQDFLEKGSFNSRLIQRALLYAIERHQLVQALHDLSLLDALTGLYNRRGLFAIAGKRVDIAARLGCRAFVLYADLDRLKTVNDLQGHAAGDTYIKLGAEALKQSFRASDVLSRIGGDEFVVVAVETASVELPVLEARVGRALERLATEYRVPFPVSISCGIARFDPTTTSLEGAIERADAAMYTVKRTRRDTGSVPSDGSSFVA